MRKRIFIVMAAVVLVAVLAGCLAACDKGGGVDLTEYNAIVDRLNAAGYSVTAGEGTTRVQIWLQPGSSRHLPMSRSVGLFTG